MQTKSSGTGRVLFTIYLVLYTAFVLVNAFSPETMERTPLAGVNLAILSGFGLIVTAFVLALIYGFVSDSHDKPDGQTKERP